MEEHSPLRQDRPGSSKLPPEHSIQLPVEKGVRVSPDDANMPFWKGLTEDVPTTTPELSWESSPHDTCQFSETNCIAPFTL